LTEGKTYSLYAPMPTFPWEGSFKSRNVTVKSQRTGVPLDATLFSPTGTIKPCTLPAVVIIPGSVVGVQTQVQWAARDLAGHGYVSLAIDPMGQGHSPQISLPSCNGTTVQPSASPDGFGSNPPVTMSDDHVNWPTTTSHVPCDDEPADSSGLNYLDALESGIDWMLSSADPVVGKVDPSDVGVAGHSLGAIVVSAAQAIDPRIKAVVAFDNLSSTRTGDEGSPRCAGIVSAGYIRPRVPALGEASEFCSSTSYPNSAKETAAVHWHAAGISAMEVVFAGASHFSFAQDRSASLGGTEMQLMEFAYYMQAFFNLYLRGESSAVHQLLATTVLGRPLSSILSSRFTSGAWMASFSVDCPDLLHCNRT
jgi:dienelactone hydrolase